MLNKERLTSAELNPSSVKSPGAEQGFPGKLPVTETPEDVANYIFDLLAGARQLAMLRHHKFLAYLIGVAAEEARLVSQGRSAAPRGRKRAAG